MIITKKRVNNIDKYIQKMRDSENVYIVISNIEEYEEKLISMGFSDKLHIGETVLPPSIGAITEYNCKGKYEVLKDIPKETFYVTQHRTIKAFGKYDTDVTMDIPYDRYQRKLIKAPSEEITIVNNNDDKAISSTIVNIKHKDRLKHLINLFLEIFKQCEIVDEDLNSMQKTKIIRKNWKILPKGKRDWNTLKREILELKEYKQKKEIDIFRRFSFINRYSPDFVAVGIGGFNDYVVFGFKEKNLFILENENSGNATYIFDREWKVITKLSKGEILEEKLQKFRLIHTKMWAYRINKIIKES